MKRKFRGDSTGVLMIRYGETRETTILHYAPSMRAMMRYMKKMKPCRKIQIIRPYAPHKFRLGSILTGEEGLNSEA